MLLAPFNPTVHVPVEPGRGCDVEQLREETVTFMETSNDRVTEREDDPICAVMVAELAEVMTPAVALKLALVPPGATLTDWGTLKIG